MKKYRFNIGINIESKAKKTRLFSKKKKIITHQIKNFG